MTNARRAAALGVLFAAALLVVVLGAHVTPGGYHGHFRYVPPHSFAPRPSLAIPATPSGTATSDSLEHAGSSWVSVPLLLAVVAIVILVVVVLWISVPRPGRWARRRRAAAPAQQTAQQAAEDLARQLARAVDAGYEDLAAGPVEDAIIACWLSLRDAALAAGVEPRQSDTPDEFVRRVLGSAQVRPAPLRELAELYREARFSAHPMTETDRAAARTALRAVGADLLAGVHA
jgi:type II secretory pathway pseudopilin PulG